MWESNWKLTSGSHLIENRLREPVQMYTCIYFGQSDRFSHTTQIRFSEFSVSFIGSSCASSHLGLLLFSCCYYLFFSYNYYSSPMIVLLFLLLLLFSHYYSSLFIAITFFPLLLFFSCCCCYFSCMVLLFFHVMK